MNGTRLRNAQQFKREHLDEENKTYLKESQWQHEFYGALVSLVGVRCAALSDGGKEVDCRGEIDLYVTSNLKWGIELMRQGDPRKKHYNRFAPGGLYENLVDDDDYILIDFRSFDKDFEKVLAPENEKFMRVIYNNDITEADIFYEEKWIKKIRFSQ
jgi:hypothetical protein